MVGLRGPDVCRHQLLKAESARIITARTEPYLWWTNAGRRAHHARGKRKTRFPRATINARLRRSCRGNQVGDDVGQTEHALTKPEFQVPQDHYQRKPPPEHDSKHTLPWHRPWRDVRTGTPPVLKLPNRPGVSLGVGRSRLLRVPS